MTPRGGTVIRDKPSSGGQAPVVDPDRLACLRALAQKILWLSTWTIHHAREPRAAEPGPPQGGRPPGLVGLGDRHHDRALPRRAAAGGPGGGQAAREPRLPRDPVPLRQAVARAARALPRPRGRAGLPVAHEGSGRGRLLDGLGRAGRGAVAVRRACAGLRPAPRPHATRRAARTDGRDRRRRRVRRGQRLRGDARGLEARRPQRLVDRRLQPAKPRQPEREGSRADRVSPPLPPGARARAGFAPPAPRPARDEFLLVWWAANRIGAVEVSVNNAYKGYFLAHHCRIGAQSPTGGRSCASPERSGS